MPEIVSLRTLVLLVAASISSARPALAADDTSASEAKRHYEEGTKAFNLGEFARAIAEFKATYNVKPDPLLLYNIAQSYRLAGDSSQALFFYKSFLRNMPGATNRKEVESLIKKLEKQVDEQKREPSSAAAMVPTPVAGAPATTSPPALAPQAHEPAAPAPVAKPARSSPPPPPPPPPVPPPVAASPGPAPSTSTTPSPAPFVPAPAAPMPQVDLTTPAEPPPAQQDEGRPLYKKWWFWAGIAGAVLIVGGIAAANAKKAPSTTLGTYDPGFK